MKSKHVKRAAKDQRITVQSASTSDDSLGQPVKTWATYKTLWAEARPTRGREFFASNGAVNEANVTFRIDFREDITAEMRVLWRGLEHAIIAPPIDIDGARRTLELMCSSGPKAA